jgi:predicted TIM-barrel fold metal-dependent hydrolase
MMVSGEMPLGKRQMWPIYAAAEKHDLPVGIHSGTIYRSAPWTNGWPSYHIEDQAAQSVGFQTQLLSLITEGVFEKFPGSMWFFLSPASPGCLRFSGASTSSGAACAWKSPWLKRAPSETVKERVRLTMQPFDGPSDPQIIREMIDQIGADMMLFSTDYPHWNFDGVDFAPVGF